MSIILLVTDLLFITCLVCNLGAQLNAGREHGADLVLDHFPSLVVHLPVCYT